MCMGSSAAFGTEPVDDLFAPLLPLFGHVSTGTFAGRSTELRRLSALLEECDDAIAPVEVVVLGSRCAEGIAACKVCACPPGSCSFARGGGLREVERDSARCSRTRTRSVRASPWLSTIRSAAPLFLLLPLPLLSPCGQHEFFCVANRRADWEPSDPANAALVASTNLTARAVVRTGSSSSSSPDEVLCKAL